MKRKGDCAGESIGFECFAAMPPLAALRMLLAFCVTYKLMDLQGVPIVRHETYVIGFVDVTRAHFCALATRDVLVELPQELRDQIEGDKVARLLKSMYGCRDAGHNWEL